MKNPHKTALRGLCVAVFVIFLVECAGAEIINGKEFQRIGGVWYQIDRDTESEYLVDTSVITARFKQEVSQQQIDDFNARYNVVLLRTNYGRYSDLLIPQGADPIEYCFIYEASGLVEVVEPNTVGEYIQCIPNDPYFNLQWGLHNTGQSGGTVDADLDAPEAWCLETGKPSVIIGILDSGTDWDHEDLGGGPSFLYENIWMNPGEDAWAIWNEPATGNNS